MTSEQIRELVKKVVKRVRKTARGASVASLRAMTDGTYNRVEFRHQGDFTLAVISSSSNDVPVIYGMAKRNKSCDEYDITIGRKVALCAAVRGLVE